MTPLHPGLDGGQPHAAHGAWTASLVWENSPNIAEAMEGSPFDYNRGRPLDWDLKTASWEWDNVGVMFPGRLGDTHLSKGSFATAYSSESGSIALSHTSQGARDSTSKKGLLRETTTPESQRSAPSQDSLLSIAQHRRLVLGLGGTDSSPEPNNDYGLGGRSLKVEGADSLVGLKLGRRTYFEDSGGGRDGIRTLFAVCPSGKKQRLQSPGVQIPRCQVEGCKQDLSSSKDYHRRHKVCEVHSKAARVIAAGFEQRFCQQCSRFHVLAEFDEGKRSCRRRLAGHNERRRKPQPDTTGGVSPGSSTTCHTDYGTQSVRFESGDHKQGFTELTERSCFIPMYRTPRSSSTSVEDSDDHPVSLGTNSKSNQGRQSWSLLGAAEDSNMLTSQVQLASQGRHPFPPLTGDRVLMVQSSKGKISGTGIHHFTFEGSGTMGSGLTLASSSGTANALSDFETANSPSVSAISDSGRALSLLSSQAWGSRDGGSFSLDVSTQADVTLEQLICESSGTHFPPRRPQSCFHSTSDSAEKLFPVEPNSPRERCLSSMSRVESKAHHRGLLSGLGIVGSFEGRKMLAVMQGQPEYQAVSINGTQRPTIDLMQLPSPQPHAPFSEFPVLRSFESSVFDSQHLLYDGK